MRALRAWSMRLAGLFNRRRRDEELAAELEAHLQLHVDDGIRSGLTPEEARRQANIKLGGLEATKELYRDRRGIPLLDAIARDLHYAVRTLRKRPGFSLIAIASLAAGIGANTAIFSLVYAVMLRPLPFPDAKQLVRIGQKGTASDVSLAEYDFLKQTGGALGSIAANQGVSNRRLVHSTVDVWIKTLPVTTGFFQTLGVPLAAGRDFNDQEGRRGTAPAAILSDRLWRDSFHSDPAVLGRSVRIDGDPFTVVGVASDFWFPQRADLFISLAMTGSAGDMGANSDVIGRLKPGMDLRQTDAELALISSRFRAAHPDFEGNRDGLSVVPYRDWLVGDTGRKLLLLLGAVGLLLLIACLNLASLLLARTAARQSEVAVRLALGSSHARLLQQFMIENMLLAAAGAVAGVAGAYWLLDGFLALVPFPLPASAAIGLNFQILLFTAGVALATAVFVSLAPFMMAARIPIHETLKRSGRSAAEGGDRRKGRDLLLMGEVAISATLLVGAALLTRSLYQLNQQPLGFSADHVITFWTPPAYDGAASAPRLRNLEARILGQLRAIPGVENAASINVIPLDGKNNFPAQRENRPEDSIGGMEIRLITPGYFATMRIALRNGRGFDTRDSSQSRAVTLINETLARRWWPNGSPIGDRIVVGQFRGRKLIDEATREVIGVVADTKTVTLAEAPRPTLYIPSSQALWSTGGTSWVVRSRAVPGLAETIRARIREAAPEQRVDHIRPMADIVAAGTAGTRFDAALFGAFAGLALFVSAIGVYGLLSYTVARRTHEVGLHIALGAPQSTVIWMILKQGFRPVAGGVAIGLVGALALSRSMSNMLFGVKPTDSFSLVAAALLLLGVGAIAGYLPARRAASVDPLVALRSE